jgi:hypothetical protein
VSRSQQVCVLDYLCMGRKLPNLRSTLSISTTALCCFMYIRMKSASEGDTEWGPRYKPPLPRGAHAQRACGIAKFDRPYSTFLALKGEPLAPHTTPKLTNQFSLLAYPMTLLQLLSPRHRHYSALSAWQFPASLSAWSV